MTRIRLFVLAALGLSITSACDRSTQSPAPAPPPVPAPRAVAAADPLDERTPLPLTAMMAAHQKEQMRDHLRVVQEIAGALALDDFAAIAASAGRIAWSEQQSTMCKHMGAGAPGFAELGETFHRTADGIVAAAHRRDRSAVAAALDATLQKCVACHATYRQEIVADDQAPELPAAGGAMPADCPMHGS